MNSVEVDITVNLRGLKIKNPLMLASGILGVSAELIMKALEAGAGAVVTKSISLKPREGYRNPTIVAVECGYINAIGLANQGARAFLKELKRIKEQSTPIVVSLFAENEEEFAKLAQIFEHSHVKAYELNLSCPHVKGVGLEVGHDPKLVKKIVKRVKEVSKKPVYVKLSPNLPNIVEVAVAAEKAGADAITATNTIRAMAIDVDAAKPILSNKVGGLSGKALKPISLRCVYEIFEYVKIPLIGSGGIATWRDAVEYLLAGASALQIGSAIAYEGLEVFKKISEGLTSYLKARGYKSVSEIVGLAHKP
ncbi:MAG: dihydroorotate dehydrogenase [Nitrososphaerales archaeon]